MQRCQFARMCTPSVCQFSIAPPNGPEDFCYMQIELDQRQELELMVHKLVEEKQGSEAATEHRLATMEQVVESCTSTLRKFHTSLKQDLDHLARAVFGEEGDAATATRGMTAHSRW